MAPPKITLYVDAVSPFGYVVYHVFRNEPIFKNVDITYVPVFLGGIMKACNNTPPIQIKNKDVWTDKERRRYAQLFSVPMKEEIPPNFPVLTLTLMRYLAALRELDGNQTRFVKALDLLSNEFWTKHVEIHKPEVFQPIMENILGKDDAARVADFAANEGKAVLAKNTDIAINDGAFGLPWFTCTNSKGETEGFWGVDKLGFALSFMGLEKPSTGVWKSLL